MSRLRAVFIDLSGTVHVDSAVLPGALEAVARLRRAGLQLRFVTNTTKESSETLYRKLLGLGLQLQRDELFTSMSAARSLVEQRGLRPLYFLTEDARAEFTGIATEEPNAVLVGLAPAEFHYEALTKAFQLVMKGCPLIAIHKGRYLMSSDGLVLGPGPFVAGLEYATGTAAEIVGKPDSNFFRSALDSVGACADEVAMIGDDAVDDCEGALRSGLRAAVLVQTGKYRPGDEHRGTVAPTASVADVGHAVDWLFDQGYC